MAKDKEHKVLAEIIYFDCPDQDIKRKPFDTQHAVNLVELQHAKGYNHWKLSEGQNLIAKDGKIISSGNTNSVPDTEVKERAGGDNPA